MLKGERSPQMVLRANGMIAAMMGRVVSPVAMALGLAFAACGTEALTFPGESSQPVGDAAVPDGPTDAAAADATGTDAVGPIVCEPPTPSTCATGCTDLQSDPAHCGACTTVCSVAAPFCQGGTCVPKCGGNLTACGSSCVNLGNAAAHCGACGAACPASAQCANARCVCTQGRDLCDGVCVDTKSDGSNCGACGTKCGAQEVCAAGRCKSGR